MKMRGRICQRPLILLLVILNGCSTLKLPDTAVKPIDDYPLSQSKQGLTVSVEPLTEAEEVKRLFHKNLLPKDILPVLVLIKNGSTDTHFYLEKKNAVLALGQGELDQQAAEGSAISQGGGTGPRAAAAASAVTAGVVPGIVAFTGASATMAAGTGLTVTTVTAAGIVFAALSIVMIPIVVMWACNMDQKRQVINHNLIRKDLRARTLAPGESQHGFIYFKLPKKTGPADVSAIRLEMVNHLREETVSFTFPVR